jgi:hypothetical protein
LGYFTFNNSTCTWDNDEPLQPAAPEKQTVGILLLSTILLVLGIMMVQHSTRKNKLLGYFAFNNSTCTWDNDGTAKPTEPTK